jgi:hypothetical protein
MMPVRMIRVSRCVPTTRSSRIGPTTSPFRQATSSPSGPLRRTTSSPTRSKTGRFRRPISSPIRSRAGQLIPPPTGAISRTSSRSQGQTSRRIPHPQIETGRTSGRDSRAATRLPLRTGQRRLNTTLRLNNSGRNETSVRFRLRSKIGRSRRLHNSSGHHNVRTAPRLHRSSTRLRRNVHNRSTRTGRHPRLVPLSSRARTRSPHRRRDRSRTTGQTTKTRRRTRKTRSPTNSLPKNSDKALALRMRALVLKGTGFSPYAKARKNERGL